jgi:hypothetical protein
MTRLKHVLLSDSLLRGVEYGILEDFKDEIIRITGAEQVEAPCRNLPGFLGKRLIHGTRYSGLRKFVPKKDFRIDADVLWVILMGPENFTLDLFNNWDKNTGIKILYLFDAFEGQLPSVMRVLNSIKWDYTFTGFQGAKTYLDKQTHREWHLVHQGVKLDNFFPARAEEKVIDFCSYGRQMADIHRSIKEYCLHTGKYYDFNTTKTILEKDVSSKESYRKYAWHLSHSIFNFCWPLNLTHPHRVSNYSPLSPRYFEAAASGNIMLGQPPQDSKFDYYFGADAVIHIEPTTPSSHLNAIWEKLWGNRHQHLQMALERRRRLSHLWSWESRVREILDTAGLE